MKNCKSAARGALVLVTMTASLCALTPVHAGEAGKGPNADPGKRGSSPSTEAVAQAALGDQLARHADRNKDVLAMIAAVRLLSQVGPRAVKPEMRTEGKPKAADAKSGAAARDTTLAALLTRARQYAGRRNDLNGLVDELVQIAAKPRQGGPARFATRISDGVTDVYTMTFRANEPVMVAITGEGASDLDLTIEDEGGSRICASDGPTDDEICRWTPRWTGAYRIRVRNLGAVANAYRLWSN